jgi:streptomycin 6-kinase
MDGLTEKFIATVPENYGSVGARWLDRLDEKVSRFLKKWQLTRTSEAPMMGGQAIALPCRNHKGKDVILKMCPDPYLLQREHDGLRYWQGSEKTVKVLRGNGARGAFVLERLHGPMPSSLDDDILVDVAEILDAMHNTPGSLPAMSAEQHIAAIMSHCIGRMSHPAVHEIVSTDDLKMAIDRALSLNISSNPEDMAVLHGDLHLENLINDKEKGLIAIDPKPFYGERAAEVALMVRDAGPVYEITSRIERASRACAVDPERTLAWTRVVLLGTAISHARHRKSSHESILTMVEFCRG